MARLYIGGLSGSGKTVVSKLMAVKYPSISALSGSEIMMQAAGLTTREELNNLSEVEKERLRVTAFRAYYEANPDLIIDGHFYLTDNDIPYFDAFILIDIDFDRLIQFRANDSARTRSLDESDIRVESNQLLERLMKLSNLPGFKLIRISNNGELKDLLAEIEIIYFSVENKEILNGLNVKNFNIINI